MIRTLVFAFVQAVALHAQIETPPVVVLHVEVDSLVAYRGDLADPMRAAMDPNVTTTVTRTFIRNNAIGDIVKVNGKPAKGVYSNNCTVFQFDPQGRPGMAIADAAGGVCHCQWEFLTADGEFVGRLSDEGHAPHPVFGGGGAWFGATGEHGSGPDIYPRPIRVASQAEDPSRRRINGGGTYRTTVYLIPKTWPRIEMVEGRPSVFHGADFAPVTAANPARPGETLVIRAKGLGPTRPDLVPVGVNAFKREPLEEVNSPVEASIGEREADVLLKVGWPGEKDVYRVDVRMPSGVPAGPATLRLTAAWVPSADVPIAVGQ